jgi:RNA polymerase sigma factor (sigma-70 family)
VVVPVSTSIDHIYRRYLRLVRAQVQRILRNNTDTDDIVQEVFIKFWRAYGETEQQDPAALLFRMATYAAISALRGRRRRSARETVFASARATTAQQASNMEVHSLLSLVSREDAEAAALYFLADMSQQEIATTLATTRHDVMCRLERFEEKLQREAKRHDWQLESPHGTKT